MNTLWGRKTKRIISLFMAFTIFISLQLNGFMSAEGSVAPVTIAEWKYTSDPTDLGIFPATAGVYKETSILQPVPSGSSYGWNRDMNAIRYQGWQQEAGKDKYWLVAVPTKNYHHITLSSAQQGKGTTGPRDFRVQISIDQQNWTNLTSEGTELPDLVLDADTATYLNNVSLPDAADDQDLLFIRWVVNSNVSTSGATIGENGSSQLISISIQGELTPPNPSTNPEAPVSPGAGVLDKTKLAEWVFANAGTNGAFPATDGKFKTTSTFKNIGGYYEDYDSSQKAISYQGWDGGNGTKYWQATVSTKGYDNITLSSQQNSSGTGPRDFKVQISTDNTTWTDVPNTNLKMVVSSFNCASNTCKLVEVPLPSSANDQDVLHIRWIVRSNTNTNGSSGIGSTGSSRIKEISVSGSAITGGPVGTPTEAVSKTPAAGATNVAPAALLTVVFNKPVVINSGANVTIVDNNNVMLGSVTSEIMNNDTLKINHPDFESGKTYTVKVPKELIKGRDDQVALANDISWSFTVTGGPVGTPTEAISKTPSAGATNVAVAAPVTVTFNKPVVINSGANVTIVDNNNVTLGSVTSEIINNDTLKINHPAFVNGKTYTVKVPKELIKGRDDQVLLTNHITWSFTIQGTTSPPSVPKLINMTFYGDPKTTRAFTWYTDVMTNSVVQVVEASKVSGSQFPENEALVYTGSAEEIQTFVTKADRTSKKKKKFITHKAIANNLTPGTVYKYRVGSGSADSWSAIGSFQTDALGNQPFRFIAGSDSQASSKSDFEPWADTFRKAIATIGTPKFLINAGDLVDNGDLEEQWQWMLGLPQNELLNVPMVPVLGGHEVQDYDGDETTPNSNFYNHFNLPKKVIANTDDGSVYSFEYGDALFLVFNSQYAGKLASNGSVKSVDQQFTDQVEWMRYVVAKSNAKWKFVAFHKGPYSAGDNAGEYEDDRVQFYRKVLIPVFDEMGIDMVFEAHDHMYMRSFQMIGDKAIPTNQLTFDAQGNAINPKGTVYLMSNAFGDKFYEKYPGYNDFFAAVNKQPFKKMFTDVSVSNDVLQFTAYTAAKSDEKSGDNGVKAYDHYGIKRTDTKPAKVEAASVAVSSNKAVISWKPPVAGGEPVRGYRIYEKNDKVKAFWSVYVPAVAGKTDYSFTVNNINAATKYDFVVRAVGTRINSDPVEVSTP
ncbi:Ig-like domain-containing protein [Paenibacillus guangzhouensis]|uniref:Ig-like domain-containing protein n=1 Tax=Paenibacillus guangzhouensis TaxID=1473112 RepID=UPI001D100D1B|nr:Ig-like domain-containing protein [Paenibacillus guangzhouensis]